MSKKEEIEKGIIKEDIVEEMNKSYLDYAMSVITNRALPDIRDGLKPVQRRILYAMSQMGLKSSAKTRKSAAIIGEVLGKYHPHGNASVYAAMVNLAQEFNTRYPLVIGQGNFGSVDGDPPAAERYTEAKLSKISGELLSSIEKNTVRFIPNYENTLKEPILLPARLPNLLLNGVHGIAVGMATSMPPHNLSEVVSAVIHLIDNENAGVKDLLKYIKGPDFPGGGVVYNGKDLDKAYETGRGGIVVRGEAEIVEEEKLTSIIITSIPYKVNKSKLIEKIGELVKNKKIEGVKELRDESTDTIRIVIVLKNTAQPLKIKNILYKNTQLEESFHYNMVGLLDGVPSTFSLKDLLTSYLNHRREMIRKAAEFDLNKAKEREHILIGLSKALDNIDKVVEIIKKSKSTEEAKTKLIKAFKLSDIQVLAILEMRLQKLVGLEQKKIKDELKDVRATIKELTELLKDPKKIDAKIKLELTTLKDEYEDKRRTKIELGGQKEINEEDLIPEKQNILLITKRGYVKRTTSDEYKTQQRGGVGAKGAEAKEDEDFTSISLSISSHNLLYFLSNKGKIYKIKAYDIPEVKRSGKGKALQNFISLDADEKITSVIPVNDEKEDKYLFFVTKLGVIKKIKLSDFSNIRKTGIIALTLQSGDLLIGALDTKDGDSVIIVTKKGKSIRFNSKSIRPLGRSAKGVKGIDLSKDDVVINALNIKKEELGEASLVTLSERGYGKKSHLSLFKEQKRGGVGIKVAELSEKTGDLINAHLSIKDKYTQIIVISKEGKIICIDEKDIPDRKRATTGVSIMKIVGDNKLTSSTKT